MPDGLDQPPTTANGSTPTPGPVTAPQRLRSTRHRRPSLVAFINDAETERVLAEELAGLLSGHVDVRRGGIRAAIAAMQTEITPALLIVDVSGDSQPLSALAELANVIEPDVSVLVIGEVDSADFYREVTRSLGAQEYLPKPLTRDKVARHIAALLPGHALVSTVLGGVLVIITGVRGGVGATTLAVNLAGYFGISLHRHTVLLDTDLHFGDAAFQLNLKPGPGLRTALDTPERIDTLLAERAGQAAATRLDLLAGEESLDTRLNVAPGSAATLLRALRRRYNFIVADARPRPGPINDDLLEQAHQRVLVMLPTLASVRAALRIMAVSPKPNQAKRPVIVLNRLGIPGGLTRREVERALDMKVDVTISDQPRQVAAAATMGELAVNNKGAIRTGVMELAKHVAAAGMLDSLATTGALEAKPGTRRRRGLFGWRS